MNTGSKTSKPTRDPPRAAPETNARETAEFWRLERKRRYKLLAPPNVRHRRKEARRWLDELTVRCTNGRMCERRPDHRHISFTESSARWHTSYEELRQADSELHRAVVRLTFEDVTRDLGITMYQWRRRAPRELLRISKVRAEMQRAGLI
jgi:hypothetical protein